MIDISQILLIIMPYYLQKTLSYILDKNVNVVLTNNHSTILRVRHINKREVHLRINRLFQKADFTTLHAIANFIEKKEATSIRYIKAFFQDHHSPKTQAYKTVKQKVLPSQGQCYNLKAIYDHLNRLYFKDDLFIPITWGRKTNKKKCSSIRLGSFSATDNLIKIHPKLDHRDIPYYVIESIVYHEMLHGYLNKKRRSLRHSKSFKNLEKNYQYYKQATQWIRNNKDLLLNNG